MWQLQTVAGQVIKTTFGAHFARIETVGILAQKTDKLEECQLKELKECQLKESLKTDQVGFVQNNMRRVWFAVLKSMSFVSLAGKRSHQIQRYVKKDAFWLKWLALGFILWQIPIKLDEILKIFVIFVKILIFLMPLPCKIWLSTIHCKERKSRQ